MNHQDLLPALELTIRYSVLIMLFSHTRTLVYLIKLGSSSALVRKEAVLPPSKIILTQNKFVLKKVEDF
jgi:hypothetical protein